MEEETMFNRRKARRAARSVPLAAIATLAIAGGAAAQVIGTYSNFDCYNDTGKTAEGFEIEIEDIHPSDVTRIFPDNFPAGTPYIRYATPDKGALQLVTFPNGHTGVRIVYGAQWVAGRWEAQWGDWVLPGTTTPLGDGTPYVAKPTYSTGDSCWTLGLGGKYASSGCEHFGFSLRFGVTPGAIRYNWLVPSPTHSGELVEAATAVAIPPSPVLQPLPDQPRVIEAVAELPEDPEVEIEQICGDAKWIKSYTSYGLVPEDGDVLDRLQKNLVPMKSTKTKKVFIQWTLLQDCPGEVEDEVEVELDEIPLNAVQVTKRYEYFAYNGGYDPENHQAICGGDESCDKPVLGINGRNEKGKFLGAHMNEVVIEE
jgi:hypothetical protein